MSKPLKIYIAGPYTAATADQVHNNVNRAIDAGLVLFLKGHFPYIPHLTHFVDGRAAETGIGLEWTDYMKWDFPWLAACDALLYLKGSRGADLELEKAKELGKIVFLSIDEIPEVNA